jgi:hypothetical protein
MASHEQANLRQKGFYGFRPLARHAPASRHLLENLAGCSGLRIIHPVIGDEHHLLSCG